MDGSEISALSGAHLEFDTGVPILGTSSLSEAGSFDIAAVDHSTPADLIHASRAGALFVPPDVAVQRDGLTVLRTADPLGSIQMVARFHASARGAAGVHPSAVIAPGATVAPTASIGPLAVVDDGARIGPGCVLQGRSTVMTGAIIGAGTIIGANAIVHRGVVIGAGCWIDSGAVVGANASSVSFGGEVLERDTGIASVRLGDHVTVGVNSVVERGTERSTVIGQGTQIGPLSVIAHDCVVGENCMIGGHVGLSARVTIGDFVVIMGQAGLAPGSKVGSEAVIGPKTGISGTVPPGARYLGWWGRPHGLELRRLAGTRQKRFERMASRLEQVTASLLKEKENPA